jgi:hypothetical protein
MRLSYDRSYARNDHYGADRTSSEQTGRLFSPQTARLRINDKKTREARLDSMLVAPRTKPMRLS